MTSAPDTTGDGAVGGGGAWDEMARKWRELYDSQAEVAKGWMEGQTQLASALLGAGGASGAGDAAADAAAMAEMWRSSLALGGVLTRNLPGAEAGGIANDMIGRMLNPMSMTLVGGNQVGDVIRRMTEGPQLADAGAMERRMAEVMQLYLAVQTATRTYEGVVSGAWARASQRFAQDLTERVRGGKPVQGRAALEVWMDIANQSLIETQRSTEFLEAQRGLLRAGMDFLLAERGLIEQLVEPAGFPTRTEIDEVHRSMQDLKRRVRALEKSARPASPRRKATGKATR